MTEDDNTLVDNDDLNTFEQDFFNPKAADEVVIEDEPEKVEEDDENGDTPPATDDEDEAEDEKEPEKEPEKPKKKPNFQTRIDELTARAREAERREDELRREIEKLRSPEVNKEQEKPLKEVLADNAPQPDAVDEKGEPLYELGEFDPKYIQALAKFTIEQERDAMRKEDAHLKAEAEREAAQNEIGQKWLERLEAAEDEMPDIRERIVELEDTFAGIEPSYGEYLASTIMSLDGGPAIMYYLSQNIDEAERIVRSGPTLATLALGRLEARLAKDPVVETKQKPSVSKAPEPPESRTRGRTGKFETPPDTDDLEAFERAFYDKK